MSVIPLADDPGPAMFLGSSIMSFALPYAAFIIVASVLFVLFRSRHSLPRLKYLPVTTVTSFTTREPGPVPAPPPAPGAAAPETGAAPEEAAPEEAAPDAATPEEDE